MAEYSFCDLKKKLSEMAADDWEPELTLLINDKEYMIIAYKNHCSFQRCGINDGTGEIKYNSLDELYNTETVDNLLLKRDWNNITDFCSTDISAYYGEDF